MAASSQQAGNGRRAGVGRAVRCVSVQVARNITEAMPLRK